jgi:hypothetical protein
MDAPPSPSLRELQTPFAAHRDTGVRSGKLLVIGGEGFAFEESGNEVIFNWRDGARRIVQLSTSPAEVRGDALLGVRVPQGVPAAPVNITVKTNLAGRQSGESNRLPYQVLPEPKLVKLSKRYARPREEIVIHGQHFDPNNTAANVVRLIPYQSRVPIQCLLKPNPTETQLRIDIPESSGSFPRPYDVVVEVHQVPSNSLVLDIRHARALLHRMIWREMGE